MGVPEVLGRYTAYAPHTLIPYRRKLLLLAQAQGGLLWSVDYTRECKAPPVQALPIYLLYICIP